MNIAITTPQGKYYGAFLNSENKYEQASDVNLPTAIAILKNEPELAGEYEADIIQLSETTRARTESVFNVKFEPTEEAFYSEEATTDSGTTKIEGRGYEDRFDFDSDTDLKIIGWRNDNF